MNIHILGIPHSITNEKFLCCPFTQGVYNFLKMMEGESSIDSILHYGHANSDLPDYVDNVVVSDDDDLMDSYGYYSGSEDITKIFSYGINDKAHINFNRRAIPKINKNVEEGDLVLFSMGLGHQLIYKSLQPKEEKVGCIEYMLGYYHSLVEHFRIYQSHSHRIAVDTRNAVTNNHDTYLDPYKFSSRVISWGPNPDDFEFNGDKDDYFVFLGRFVEQKGIDLCIQLANVHGFNLKIAGQGSLSDLEYSVEEFPENIEILGPVDKEERRNLLKNAKGLLAPSIFYESLGWQVIEAMLSGTPVITTDFGGFTETNIPNITGYRCNTFSEFSDAIENIDLIDNQQCYESAYNRFNYDIVKGKYLSYFDFVKSCLNGSGFYEGI
mgnify:CR=1 FL=1|tara:strand:+ start:688 stop:1830 length:1143 start_codon:yes stop_codon:yes gene_type:complete